MHHVEDDDLTTIVFLPLLFHKRPPVTVACYTISTIVCRLLLKKTIATRVKDNNRNHPNSSSRR